jgi:hypothetical protein
MFFDLVNILCRSLKKRRGEQRRPMEMMILILEIILRMERIRREIRRTRRREKVMPSVR